jgi:hypothetical protein
MVDPELTAFGETMRSSSSDRRLARLDSMMTLLTVVVSSSLSGTIIPVSKETVAHHGHCPCRYDGQLF